MPPSVRGLYGNNPLRLDLDLDDYTKAIKEADKLRMYSVTTEQAIRDTMGLPSHLLQACATTNLCSEIVLPNEVDILNAKIAELEDMNQVLEEALVESLNQQVTGQ